MVHAPGAGPGGERRVALPPEGLTLGREADNGLVLEDAGASRHHARLLPDGRGWLLEDLGSSNGTWVGGACIQRQRLDAGQAFRVGDTWLRLEEDPRGGSVEPAPQPSPQPSPGPSPRRRGPWAALLAAGCGLLLALPLLGLGAWLLAESRRPDLLPSQALSLLKNGWSGRLRPAARPTTGTAPLDVSPHPALRLSAGAGAMDRARSFRARPLEPGDLDRAAASLPGMVPAAGFELDAGMAEEDCFPGPVRMEWDPGALGIPAAAARRLQLVRVAPDGRVQRLATRLEDGRLVADLRHNGIFFAVFLGFAGWEVISAIKDHVDKGAFDANASDGAGPFRVFWPKTLALANTPEYRRVEGALKARWDAAMALPVQGGDRQVWTARFYHYLADPEVQRLQKVMEDPAWRREHYLPPAVANGLDAFDRAHAYLHGTRGFLKRGDQIEIHFLDPWNGSPDAFAYTLDGSYTYPYVHVNLPLLPRTRIAPGATSEAMDELHTTALHELFHVVQKEYFNWTKYVNWSHFRGGGKFAWFCEATAVVMEEEAEAHYLAKGWVKVFKKTFEPGKFMGLYKLPLDAQGASEQETQRKGYAASRFLLSLRDRYYGANRDAFLKALLEAFGTFRTGPVDALKQVTSQSDRVLSADFMLFCAKEAWPIYNNMPVPQAADLSAANPRRTWKDTGPLSSPCIDLRWRSVPAADLKAAKVLVRTHRGLDRGIQHRWGWSRGAATEFRTLTGPSAVAAVKDSGHHTLPNAGMALQRVEAYTASPWFAPSGDTTSALLLLPPKAPPRIRMNPDRKSLRVEVPETPLWRLGESREIRVRFHGSLSGGRPLPISLGKGRLEADIDLGQIMGTQLADRESASLLKEAMKAVSMQDLQDMIAISEFIQGVTGQKNEIRVSYSEVVVSDPDDPEAAGVEGPESEIFKVPAEAQPGTLSFDIAGTWSGQVLFLHRPVIFHTGSPGVILMDADSLHVQPSGAAPHGGTQLQVMEKTPQGLVPTGASIYVYRLPGRKLWLTIPPAVLYPEGEKREEAPGWWSWLAGKGARK
jgi:hypothetical protein